MEGKNKYDRCLGTYAATLIHRKGRELVRGYGLTDEDCEDFEQEAAKQLWLAERHYDASRSSPETFANRVVNNKLASLLQERRAAKRSAPRKPVRPRLDVEPEEEDSEVADTSDMLGKERRRRSDELLQLDLKRLITVLPDKERELCCRLLQGSISEVSRDTGTPRSSLYDAIASIRQHFERAGLRRYLQPDTFRSFPVCTRRRR